MKSIMLLKIITGIMAILIVLGLGIVIHKIADSSQKIKSKNDNDIQVVLAESEKIKEMFACGADVCVVTQGNPSGQRLMIISSKSGKIQHILTFLEKSIN